MTAHRILVCAVFALCAVQMPLPAHGDGETFRANLAKWNRGGASARKASPANYQQPAPAPEGALPAEPAPAEPAAPQPVQPQELMPQPAAPAEPLNEGGAPPRPAPGALRSQSPQTAQSFSEHSVEQWVGEPDYGDNGYDSGCSSCGFGGCGGYGCRGGGLFGLGFFGGCGLFDAGCHNACGDACGSCRPPLWWFRSELMLGWRHGRGYPPLVTTDPANEDINTAGILPDANILYDGSGLTTQTQAGFRLDFGTWLDFCETVGVGGRFWLLGKDSGAYAVSSADRAVLAIPFFDVDNQVEDALTVSHPDAVEGRQGRIDIASNNEVFGADIYARILYARTCYGRLDLLSGYHFSRINEDFQLAAGIEVTGIGGQDPTGRLLRVVDQIDARNEFHGGVIGLGSEFDWCGITLRTTSKVALGNMRQRVNIDGSTTLTDPNDPPVVTAGGLFTAATNSGRHERNEFCAVPEANLTLGYRISPHCECTVGYTFIYWSNVVRPGSLIDRGIDTDGQNATRPAFAFQTDSFWVQSLNLGLNWRF